MPYCKGLSESLKRTCNKYGVQVYFKGGNTTRSLLMAPKDEDPMPKKSGVIYRYKCDRVECDEEYIGECPRTFGERFREHQKAPSPIFDHCNTTGHKISLDNFSIVGREDQNQMRTIKEALYIRVNNPSLNRNIGRYHLPHIWDEVLFNISELKINNWPMPIPSAYLVIMSTSHPPCSGHSICHLAITSAIFSCCNMPICGLTSATNTRTKDGK